MAHTSFVLHAACPDIQEELDDGVGGRQNLVEEDKANNGRSLSVEAKVCIQRAVVDEDREQGEHVE